MQSQLLRRPVGADLAAEAARDHRQQRRQRLDGGLPRRGGQIRDRAVARRARPVAYASAGKPYLSRKSGEIVRTDNLFDVALQGDAWLGIQTPSGPVYTRDGRMRMTETGELMTLNNQPVLDAGARRSRLEPNGGPPRIGRDGTITQNGRPIGALGLFKIDEQAELRRVESSGVVPDRPATPWSIRQAGVHQGYIERANVNPVLEMTKLIMVQRASRR